VNHASKNSGKASTWLLLSTALSGFLLAAGAAAAAVPPSSGAQRNFADRSVETLLADAHTAIKGGNFRLALIALKNAVRAAPSSNEAHLQLGIVLFRVRDFAGAERELRQAWKGGTPENTVLPYLFQVMLARQEYQQIMDQFPDPGLSKTPTAPDILKARAFVLQHLGRPAEAMDAMDRALRLRRDAQGLLAKGSLALQQGDLNSAGRFADEAMSLAPNNIPVALFRLRTLRLLRDDAAAMALGNQLLAKYPDSFDIRFAHIEMLIDQKQYPAAKGEVDAVLAKQPGSYTAKYYKALLMSQAGDARGAWDVALTLPKEFLEISPTIGLRVSQLAVNAGRQEVAANILGRVLSQDSTNLEARRRLAAIYLDQRNANLALTTLGPIRVSSDPDVMRLLAQIYTRLDRPDDAARITKKLGEAPGMDTQNIRARALADMRAGRLDQAIKALKEGLAREPANAALVGPLVGALTQARRFPEALAAADRLGQDSKQRAVALAYRGDILMLQGKMPEARTAFDKAVELEPNNSAARLSRADFLAAAQKYDEAAKDLRAVLASDINNIAVRVRLADIAAQQGKDLEVRKLLAEATARAPQDASPRIALIRYLMARTDHKAALKAADDLVRLQPASADGVALRGQIQSALGQKQEAVASFRRLVSLAPTAPQSQMMLGDALFSNGDRAGAQRALDEAVRLGPDLAAAKSAQINLQLVLGKTDMAVSSARTFQASHPGLQADILLADTLVKARHPDQASDVLTKSLAARPNPSVQAKLLQLKIAANDKKGAADLMARWLARNPNDLSVRQSLAIFLMGEKDDSGARAQYELILKQDPDNVLAMNNLGSLLQDRDPGRALSLLSRASQLAPNSADVTDSLGWVSVRQKKVREGVQLLQRAHAMRPTDGQITYHLAAALDAAGDRSAARKLLGPLLASGTKFQDLAAAQRLAADWR
jgi:putative PEP-CTERM system TPR-repeat lipoprotein